jgi:hypothetical protein
MMGMHASYFENRKPNFFPDTFYSSPLSWRGRIFRNVSVCKWNLRHRVKWVKDRLMDCWIERGFKMQSRTASFSISHRVFLFFLIWALGAATAKRSIKSRRSIKRFNILCECALLQIVMTRLKSSWRIIRRIYTHSLKLDGSRLCTQGKNAARDIGRVGVQ